MKKLLIMVLALIFCMVSINDPALAKKKGKKSKKGTLVIVTKDTEKKLIAVPVYVNGKLNKNPGGELTLSLKAKKYTIKFGSLEGYTLKSPKKKIKKVNLKAGKRKTVKALYSRDIIVGKETSLAESSPFNVGKGASKVTAAFEAIDTESVYFQGSGTTGKKSDVAYQSGITDISQVKNAAKLTYTKGSVGPVKEGEIVVYYNKASDTYGAVKVDDIRSAGGSLSSRVKAASDSTTLDVSWYVITNNKSNFNEGDWTAPSTTASPAGGSYTEPQTVTLSCADDSGGSGCYRTYYTTDGSEPTTSSAVYSSEMSFSSSKTLKFFSVDNYGNQEAVKTESYTVNYNTDVTSSNVTVTVRDHNTVQDDYFDLYVNGTFVGAVNNEAGGSTSYDVTLQSGDNVIELKLTQENCCGTWLEITIEPGGWSKEFGGSSDQSWTITAP